MVPQFGSARRGLVDVGLGRLRVMRWCPSSVWPPLAAATGVARRRGCGLDGFEAASCRRAEHCVDDSHVGDGIE